jgi:hypothetical protein
MIYFPHQILFRWSNQRGCLGRGIWQPWGRREMYKDVWWKGNIFWYRRNSQHNITMQLKETWRSGVEWTHLSTNRTSADSGENSNVPSESTKRGKFVNYNLAYQHFKKDASPWNSLPISRTIFSVQSHEIIVQLQGVGNLETNVMIVAPGQNLTFTATLHTNVWMCVCVWMYLCIYTHRPMYVRTDVRIYMYVRMYVCMHACMYVRSPAVSSVPNFMVVRSWIQWGGRVQRLVIFGLLTLQVLVPRQFAYVSRSGRVGFQEKPCGCDCPSHMRKIRCSNFQTLETIDNFVKFHLSGN